MIDALQSTSEAKTRRQEKEKEVSVRKWKEGKKREDRRLTFPCIAFASSNPIKASVRWCMTFGSAMSSTTGTLTADEEGKRSKVSDPSLAQKEAPSTYLVR